MKTVGFQSCLAAEIKAFVAHKRALARRFHTEESALRLLDRYLVEQGVTNIAAVTPELLDRFLASRPRTRPRSYNHLLGVLRRLFCWLVEQGTLCHSPLVARPRRATMRRIPFLFDPQQARRLLDIAGRLPDNPRAPLRGATYSMVFALLYGLGLRVGEVSRLCCKDIDLDRHLLVIRQTKFSKSRLVPFGPRIAQRLDGYIQCREQRFGPLRPDTPVFSFGRGQEPLHPGTISQTFHHLLPRLSLDVPPGTSPPRLHDLRHSFAVRALLRWYRAGIDPAQRLIYLSTFLGHVNPTSTAVYLTITTELLHEASGRFEEFAVSALKEVIP